MIIGIDIGGTSIKFGVIDADFRVVYRESAATKTDGTDLDIVAQLKEVCLRLKAAYPVRCIGIGSPGTIDTARGLCAGGCGHWRRCYRPGRGSALPHSHRAGTSHPGLLHGTGQ